MEIHNSYSKVTSWALFAVMLSVMLSVIFKLPEPFSWFFMIAIIFILFKSLSTSFDVKKMDKGGFYLTLTFIGWLVLEFIRATFYAEGYWMWKMVISNLIITMFYIVILVSSNLTIVRNYWGLYWKSFFPLVILSIFFYKSPTLLDFLPYSILMLFFAFIPKKNRLLLIGICVLYFIANEHRNDLAKIIVAASIGLFIFYFYRTFPKMIRIVHIAFLSAPFIFLWLGVSSEFNVLNMDDYIKGDHTRKRTNDEGKLEDVSLKADSRTFIFENVFYTLNNNNDWILGRSPAFGDEGVDNSWGTDESTGLKGRYGNEVGIMDILLWYGVIGVIIYFLMFFRASYLAIYKSKSRYVKGVGLYVAYLWLMSFIWEKPMFQTFYMMDLVLLGLCFSNKFRQMNDREVEIWVRGIFSSRKVKRINIRPHESPLDIKRTIS